MLDLVNGDTGMSRHLSKVLKILADSPVDKDLQHQLREILTGKGNMRDLEHNESFMRLSDAIIPRVLASDAGKSPEEMQRLAEAGEAILERYRNGEPETPDSGHPTSQTAPASPPPTDQTPHSDAPRPANNVVPGTRKPDRDRIVMPEEPDDDDQYYQDRRRRGWLE
ncbi:hypothetical protein [Nocardia salmonicida]|uniref:hypothetical protein n=1 Tax=Nocardia salmonicida TaxID=53431 RepID=UPI0033D0E294